MKMCVNGVRKMCFREALAFLNENCLVIGARATVLSIGCISVGVCLEVIWKYGVAKTV